MRILEIVEASQEIVGETRCCCVNEVRALGVLKDLLKRAYMVVVGSGVREEWSRKCRAMNEAEIKAYTVRQRLSTHELQAVFGSCG